MKTVTLIRSAILVSGFVASSAALGASAGLGLIAGEPSGLTLRVGDVGLASAWSFREEQIYIHGDYLLGHSRTGAEDNFDLFAGLGARAILKDDKDKKDAYGVRFPLGVMYSFTGLPLEIFAELAPVWNVTPESEFEANGGVGFRVLFFNTDD